MFPALGQIFTPSNLLYYFQFALISLGLAAVSLAIGFILAVLLQAMRMSSKKLLNAISTFYIEVIRGTPMLVQISYIFTVIPLIIGQITGSVIRPNHSPEPVSDRGDCDEYEHRCLPGRIYPFRH